MFWMACLFMRKSIQVFYNALVSLSLSKMWRLLKLAFGHPIFFILSTFASLKAFAIAQKKYPKTSSTNGVGNAYRHALWTSMILMYCCKVSSPQKSLDWCRKMTNLHEELFPNLPLETKMDLHNNEVGISLFFQMLPGIHRQFFETQFLVDAVQKLVDSAEILTQTSTLNPQKLVYLTD